MRNRHQHFINIAKEWAKQSTCDRLAVGCVLVKEDRDIASGYNGAARRMPHCSETNHGHGFIEQDGTFPGRTPAPVDHCKAAVHAEANAVANAAFLGASTRGTVAYVTHNPCTDCYHLMINAGVEAIIVAEIYRPREYEGSVPVYHYTPQGMDLLSVVEDVCDHTWMDCTEFGDRKRKEFCVTCGNQRELESWDIT